MDFISVLEGHRYGRGAVQPLTERHWSNLLAWVLDPAVHPEFSLVPMFTALMELAGIPILPNAVQKVERERPVSAAKNGRIMDLDVCLASGSKLSIENKVDRSYEDARQLEDERDALGPYDHLILLCPRGFSLLQQRTRDILTSDPRLHHVRWLELSQRWAKMLVELPDGSLEFQVIEMMTNYWPRRENEDFLWQVEAILEENAWDCFYPDEFKTAFCRRFRPVYQSWVDQKGERGLGGAHSILTQKLVGLTQKRAGQLRLTKTGNSRAPLEPGWGFPTIFEYRVLID